MAPSCAPAGKFVKSSSGYDLTQLLDRLRRHAWRSPPRSPSRSQPRLAEAATILAPFATLAEVAQAVPHDREQRRRPEHPRVHRRAGDGRHHRKCRARSGHPRRDQGGDVGLPGRRAGRDGRRTGWKRTSSSWPRSSRRSVRWTSSSSPPTAGAAADLGPGEGVLRVQGSRRGRHRRRRHPTGRHPRVPGPGGRAGQPPRRPHHRLRPRRRRQCPPVGLPARRGTAPCPAATRSSTTAIAAGGAIAGEHGIGTEKLVVLPRHAGPREPRPHARHQEGLRPAGASSGPTGFSGRHAEGARRERGPRPVVHAGRCRVSMSASPIPERPRCTSSPRWTTVPGDARGPHALRRRGHRRGRRLRPRGRTAGRDAAAPGPGPGQRPGQPAQRPARPHAAGQHRRATTPPTTPASTPRSNPTSPRWPARSRAGTG